MINRGVGGEEVGDILKRFDTSVLAEHPDLVLWQLGTNSVIRDDKLSVRLWAEREASATLIVHPPSTVTVPPWVAHASLACLRLPERVWSR